MVSTSEVSVSLTIDNGTRLPEICAELEPFTEVSIEKDRAMGMQRNVNQTPTVYITAHGKTEALPGGGVDYKLLKSYFDYLLRQ